MNLSGSIGYTLLSKNKKKILIFADAHSDVEYCKDNFVKISELFNKLLNNDNYQILLEEVNRNNVELDELWPESEHIQNLKKLYLKNKNLIIPIDIRPQFYKFSWEIFLNDKYKKFGDIKLNDYLENLNLFFFKDKIDKKKYNLKLNDKIKKLIIDENYYNNLKNNFDRLKNSYSDYLKTYDNFLNKKLIDIYNIDQNVFHLLDKLLSSIMEWYCTLIMLTTNKISILHAGLFHSREIVKILLNDFKFNIIENYGITSMPSFNLKSCVILSKKMLENINLS